MMKQEFEFSSGTQRPSLTGIVLSHPRGNNDLFMGKMYENLESLLKQPILTINSLSVSLANNSAENIKESNRLCKVDAFIKQSCKRMAIRELFALIFECTSDTTLSIWDEIKDLLAKDTRFWEKPGRKEYFCPSLKDLSIKEMNADLAIVCNVLADAIHNTVKPQKGKAAQLNLEGFHIIHFFKLFLENDLKESNNDEPSLNPIWDKFNGLPGPVKRLFFGTLPKDFVLIRKNMQPKFFENFCNSYIQDDLEKLSEDLEKLSKPGHPLAPVLTINQQISEIIKIIDCLNDHTFVDFTNPNRIEFSVGWTKLYAEKLYQGLVQLYKVFPTLIGGYLTPEKICLLINTEKNGKGILKKFLESKGIVIMHQETTEIFIRELNQSKLLEKLVSTRTKQPGLEEQEISEKVKKFMEDFIANPLKGKDQITPPLKSGGVTKNKTIKSAPAKITTPSPTVTEQPKEKSSLALATCLPNFFPSKVETGRLNEVILKTPSSSSEQSKSTSIKSAPLPTPRREIDPSVQKSKNQFPKGIFNVKKSAAPIAKNSSVPAVVAIETPKPPSLALFLELKPAEAQFPAAKDSSGKVQSPIKDDLKEKQPGDHSDDHSDSSETSFTP